MWCKQRVDIETNTERAYVGRVIWEGLPEEVTFGPSPAGLVERIHVNSWTNQSSCKRRTGPKKVRTIDKDYKRPFSRTQIHPHRLYGQTEVCLLSRERDASDTALEPRGAGVPWRVPCLVPGSVSSGKRASDFLGN